VVVLQFTEHFQPPTTNHQPPTTNHRTPDAEAERRFGGELQNATNLTLHSATLLATAPTLSFFISREVVPEDGGHGLS
jgi:hypothetical protein